MVASIRQDLEPWAVVFGAGLSVASGLPDWRALTTEAAIQSGIYDPDEQELSELHSKKFTSVLEEAEAAGARPFWSLITTRVCASAQPSELHEALAVMPFQLFVSLNYDCLLEQTFLTTRGSIQSMAYPNIDILNIRDSQLLYLHGRCPGDGSELSSATAVLTRSSYESAYRAGAVLEMVLKVILSSYNILFVGTSVDDPEISRIMAEIGTTIRSGGVSSASARRRLALTPTRSNEYRTGMQWTWGGPNEIQPIFYPLIGRNDHSNLDRILKYLAAVTERNDAA